MTVVAVNRHWDSWIVPTIWFGVLATGFLFYTRGLMDFRAKLIFCLVVWVDVIIYSVYTVNMPIILASVGGCSVLMSMLDILVANYISLGATIFIFVYNYFFIHNLRIYNNTFGLEIIMQFIAVLIMELIEIKLQNDMLERQEKLNETMAELIDAEKCKSDFLANVSHELRTPLNTICGLSDTMLANQTDGILKDNIKDINDSGRRLKSIVDDILDYTELENDAMNIVEEQYDITSLLQDVLAEAQLFNQSKNLEIIMDCDARIPSALIGDSHKIYRVLVNIMDNAIKFTHTGGVLLEVGFKRNGDQGNLKFVIRDTGVGMSESELERLDNVYNQVDSNRNRLQNGIGLGLAISKKTVCSMGGFIHIDSEENVGSTVIISIPQKIGQNTPVAKIDEQNKVRTALYLKLARFDNAIVREAYIQVVDHLIENLAIKVIVCVNLAEFKQRMERGEIQTVITSYHDYVEDLIYFNRLSDRCRVGVICDVNDDLNRLNPAADIVSKPFHVFSVANFLNRKNNNIYATPETSCDKHDFKMEGVRILAVDDMATNLKVTEALLERYGIREIDTAESGMVACKKTQQHQYDLIFLDHMMPQMDGIETLHRIKEHPGFKAKRTPVVAMTANAVGSARDMFLAEGFDDFISKPIETTQLERILRKYLEKNIVSRQAKLPKELRESFKELMACVEDYDRPAALEMIDRIKDETKDEAAVGFFEEVRTHVEKFEFISAVNLLCQEDMI